SGRAWLIGAVAAGTLIVGAGGGVAAAGDDAGDGPTFLDRVAGKLGIETERLEQAVKDARSDEIDEATERGDLSQEQADRLRERLDDTPLHDGFGPALRDRERDGHPFGKLREAFGLGVGLLDGFSDLATFLGMEESALMKELAEGESLASVAEANGKSRDELKTFIQSEADARIDEAVESGVLSEERAAELKSRLGDHLDEIVDGGLPGFKWRFGSPDGFHFEFRRRGDESSPAVPQSGSSRRP
ncbi:MAG: hypothetical protein WD359_00845, partial [Dehalococcoidia bacterium]